ncbi:hypothetical protein [Almyronema epifaneia]|uniref:Uncharacterized protein n=1 Tax=Almyronema epifaneia S1 TaxID=2991925 RepID=A0ABW6IKQ2_9CYAN
MENTEQTRKDPMVLSFELEEKLRSLIAAKESLAQHKQAVSQAKKIVGEKEEAVANFVGCHLDDVSFFFEEKHIIIRWDDEGCLLEVCISELIDVQKLCQNLAQSATSD